METAHGFVAKILKSTALAEAHKQKLLAGGRQGGIITGCGWLPRGAPGLAWSPYIFTSYPDDKVPEWLRAHERVHIRQEEGFGDNWEYLASWIGYFYKGIHEDKTILQAYLTIPYEQEAFRAQGFTEEQLRSAVLPS